MKKTITILSILAAGASFALAADGSTPAASPAVGVPPSGEHAKRPRMNPEEAFKKLDTNTDGALSLDEFKAGPMGKRNPEKVEERFKKLDADGNGSVSLDEFKAGRKPRKGGDEKHGAPEGAPKP